jgi:syntaxin 7
MSFDRLNSLEAQPTTMHRDEDPQYRDDPGFDHLAETLSDQLFTLTSNISRLSNQIALLGTKRDTERVRERVHNLLEETRAGFKDVGEGIKKVQTWEDVNVRLNSFPCLLERLILTSTVPALPEVDTTEAIV